MLQYKRTEEQQFTSKQEEDKTITRQEANRNYEEAIRTMIKLEGIEVTNAANHLALEKGIITLEQFLNGAEILANAFINR